MGDIISFERARERLARVPVREGRYILTFDAPKVMLLYEHALYSADHVAMEGEPAKSGLFMVATQDDGCFLMSSGNPGLRFDGTLAAPGEQSEPYRVYARGLSPDNAGFYKRKLQVYGAENVVDLIPLSSIRHGLTIYDEPFGPSIFEIGVTEYSFFVIKPKPAI